MTLNEQVYERMKRMIALRELAPGSSLVTRILAAKLGVSRIPILEAIRRLERDGLVTVVPMWGASVREWTPQEIREAYYIRRALEGEAARLFVLGASPEDRKKLSVLSDLFDELALGDAVKCDEADMEFHLHIARSTGCHRLSDLIENSKIQTATIFGLATLLEPGAKGQVKSIGNHKPLVKALRGKDPAAAIQAMWAHIDLVLSWIEKVERRTVVSMKATQVK